MKTMMHDRYFVTTLVSDSRGGLWHLFLCICFDVLYPGHGPEDIRRYPGHMTRDTAAVISWVICPGYLLISLGHVANHQGR